MIDIQNFYSNYKMSHLKLEQLLQDNSTLQTQIQQRLNSLSIQLSALNSQPQDLALLEDYLNAYDDWKTRSAKNLLNQQEQILFRGEKTEEIRRYQETIQELSDLLKGKEEQVAYLQNDGRSFKRAGFNIEKLTNQEEFKTSVTVLVKQLAIKAQLQKQIATLQQHFVEKETGYENTEKLETTFLQMFVKQTEKSNNLNEIYSELLKQMKDLESQQIQSKYLSFIGELASQKNQNNSHAAKSAKTISQTSDQD